MEPRKVPFDFHRCDFCGCYGTRYLSNFLKHVRQHQTKLQSHPNVSTCHSNAPEIYKCELCDYESNLKVSLTHHLNTNHKNLKNQNQLGNVLRQCGCGDFQTYSLLLVMKHCFKCDELGHLPTNVMDNEIVNRFECGQCTYKTKNKSYLKRLLMMSVWYHCDKCKYKSRYKSHLKVHVTNIHTDSASVVLYHYCDNCEYKSKQRRKLKKHITMFHTYSACNKCRTKWNSSLKKHTTYVHTESANIVWYHCDRCEYKSRCKSTLEKHTASVHTVSGDVWYHCNTCKNKYKSEHTLKKHVEKWHKFEEVCNTDSANVAWYHCDKCTYKTKYKAHLATHISNVHTDSANVGWYHCDRCEFTSKCKSSWKRHTAIIHTVSGDVVWYHCDTCINKYKSEDMLERHKAKWHKFKEVLI